MVIMKFGGTSMGSAQRIKQAADIICAEKKQKIVVVSAMTGVTNMLLEASDKAMKRKKSFTPTKKIIKQITNLHLKTAKELIQSETILAEVNEYIYYSLHKLEHFLNAISFIKEMTTSSYDQIVAVGEKLSAKLLSAHLQDRAVVADYVNLEKIVYKQYDKADPAFFKRLERRMCEYVKPILEKKSIPICTGFFGKMPKGIIYSVGRGYSDFCAAILGSVFEVKEIQIWTDVDGIMSADPRIVKNAFVLSEVSFNEAAEMASFGAKVLHPQTIWPAVKRNVPVRIKNTINTNFSGTLITAQGKISKHLCKAITAQKGVTMVSVIASQMPSTSGYLAKVFDIFARHDISIDLVVTSEISVSFTVQQKAKTIRPALTELSKLGRVNVLEKQAVVCAIGEEMSQNIGSGSEILRSIANQGLNANAIARDSLQINISCVINEKNADSVVQALHRDILENNHG